MSKDKKCPRTKSDQGQKVSKDKKCPRTKNVQGQKISESIPGQKVT